MAICGCLALAFVGYATALPGEFVFDDKHALVFTDCHRGLHRIPAMFDLRSRSVCNARPLRSVTYALDYSLWGLDPFGYHLTNVLLHGAVGLLLFLLALRLGGSRRAAGLIAALFLLHPIGTEVVAYVSGRRDQLAALFSLAAAVLFFPGTARRGPASAIGAVLCFALAMLAHEGAAALPAAIALIELARHARAQRERRLASALRRLVADRRAVLTIGAMLLAVAAYGGWRTFVVSPSEPHGLWGGTLGAHVGTVARVHAHYLEQLAYPVNLIADYSEDAFPPSRSLFELPALLSVALLCAIFTLALRCARRAPLGAATVLAYFTLLLPASQIVIHHELLAEHRIYLAAACYCALLGWALHRVVAWRTALGWALVAAVLLAYAALTNNRNLDWRTPETLWTKTVAQVPRCARALGNLGGVRLSRGDLRGAKELLSRALEIRPDLCAARINLGETLLRLGEQRERGLRLIEEARCIEHWRLDRRRARAYALLGRWADAAAAYRRAIADGPPRADNHDGLARALHALRDPRAIAEYRKALALSPGWAVPMLGLARALAETCQQQQARLTLEALRARDDAALRRAADSIQASMIRACPAGSR